jgi:hypothetical protein
VLLIGCSLGTTNQPECATWLPTACVISNCNPINTDRSVLTAPALTQSVPLEVAWAATSILGQTIETSLRKMVHFYLFDEAQRLLKVVARQRIEIHVIMVQF